MREYDRPQTTHANWSICDCHKASCRLGIRQPRYTKADRGDCILTVEGTFARILREHRADCLSRLDELEHAFREHLCYGDVSVGLQNTRVDVRRPRILEVENQLAPNRSTAASDVIVVAKTMDQGMFLAAPST